MKIVPMKYYLLSFLLLTATGILGQNYHTVTYYTNNSVKLEMDIFQPESISETLKPAFIYVHGGGFASGQRSDGHAICKYMSEHGYVAVTISYTLYMKDKSFSCDGITSEKIKAIRYGTNDLWLATIYLIENSDKFKINTSQIFISGCSAGAETVLHAQFWNYQKMNWTDQKLPENFRYAGVISGAGALMDLNLINENNLVPLMMFHGDKDNLVPYGTAAHHFCDPTATGWLMFFGSESIYEFIRNLNGTVKMYTFTGSGHEVANYYFEKEMNQVLEFCNSVIEGKHFQVSIEQKL